MKKCNTEIMKELKLLEIEKNKILDFEAKNCTVSYVENESIIESGYSYEDTRTKVNKLDNEIRRLKGLLAYSNVTTIVDGFDMTINEALIYLAQLNKQLERLRDLALKTPLARRMVYEKLEYTKITYDQESAVKEYERIQEIIPRLQMAIDRTNLTNMIEC